TPLKPAEQMTTILDVMDQTTTLLTRHNTQEQLATLTGTDMLLQPELGDIAFSSFAEAEEAIAAGRSEERRVGKECFNSTDSIRDFHVTGVQTCALPISLR